MDNALKQYLDLYDANAGIVAAVMCRIFPLCSER